MNFNNRGIKMVNQMMFGLGDQPSAIRELFAYGLKRKAEIGQDKVFDFSLGNPSVPAPEKVKQTMLELSSMSPQSLHGYTAAQGLESTRSAIAKNLNKRFNTNIDASNLYMTMGAAASLTITINALTELGDEIIVISPYFPEYKMWIESAGAKCVEVLARQSDFQIDCTEVANAINNKTRAVIINTPNNPVGTVYSKKNLEDLAVVLKGKSQELGPPIYLISDEPYREIIYSGADPIWIPHIYKDTIICYSWSKSLSMPGERIGYVLVGSEVHDSKNVYTAICGAGRALGYVCAPAFFQMVIERCVDEPTDVKAYAENRELLCAILDEFGYEYIEPEGAFYLWVKSLEDDAEAFSEKAKAHELLIVPSDSFGIQGWIRIGYCVDRSVIENSRDAFAALMNEYK